MPENDPLGREMASYNVVLDVWLLVSVHAVLAWMNAEDRYLCSTAITIHSLAIVLLWA